jgi:hypothetical protein
MIKGQNRKLETVASFPVTVTSRTYPPEQQPKNNQTRQNFIFSKHIQFVAVVWTVSGLVFWVRIRCPELWIRIQILKNFVTVAENHLLLDKVFMNVYFFALRMVQTLYSTKYLYFYEYILGSFKNFQWIPKARISMRIHEDPDPSQTLPSQ